MTAYTIGTTKNTVRTAPASADPGKIINAIHHRIQRSFRRRACRLLLTGVVSVSGVNDAKHVVGGRLLLLVPVLVDEPGGAAPLPQFGEDFSLWDTASPLAC